MHTERLLKTAELLRNLDREKNNLSLEIERFNLYYWNSETTTYGTVACAVGHAMYHPWFNSQGLIPTKDKYFVFGKEILSENVLVPSYKDLKKLPAVASFYEISEVDADFLFMPTHYWNNDLPTNNPIVVAKRIEKFVADNTPLAVPQFESEPVPTSELILA